MPQRRENRSYRGMAVDPEPYMRRMLHYRERHSGWYIFRSAYWGVYLFLIGILFMVQSTESFPVGFTFGISMVILAVMLVIYGFATALHNKLMKKYG